MDQAALPEVQADSPIIDLKEVDWRLLVSRIERGQCTPFLGAGAAYPLLPLAGNLAEELANEFEYPLENRRDLSQVAQFLAVSTGDGIFPKQMVGNRLKGRHPDFQDPADPHVLVAELNLPIYVTTNYDDFLVQALEHYGKKPRVEICRWNEYVEESVPSVFDDPEYVPSNAEPLVFHLHGSLKYEGSMVVTEDDYIDFLLKMGKRSDLIPPAVQGAFSRHSLLFLGYSLADLNFRTLFRMLSGYLNKSSRVAHISVQLPSFPEQGTAHRDAALEYLNNYFKDMQVRVFWGDCRSFTLELRKKLVQAQVLDGGN
ncbi:MAG TPA: SIR2 family protein [Sedimenticola sp.]|nr:SIR2 family protein [Sedimenticola sp.]